MTTRKVEDANINHLGEFTVYASKFKVLDDTDPSKVAKFVCSSITPGTESEITIPAGDDTAVYLTAVQTLTNKKLQDSTTSFVDDGDPTKAAKFECSGITTATTRTLTVPNSNGTIAYLAGSTLTTTTLSSPTLSGTMTATGATISAGTVAPTVLTVPANTALTTPALTAPTVATSLLITSTTGALGIPIMTEAQRDLLTPAKGWIIYNTTTDKLNVYTTGWEVIVSA